MRVTYKIAANTWGPPRVGKTRWALTAPRPAVVVLDGNTRYTAERFMKETGRKVVLPEKDLIRAAGAGIWDPINVLKMDQEHSIELYRSFMQNEMLPCYYRFLGRKDVDTVIVDTATQLFQNILFAFFGRTYKVKPVDRSGPNQTMRELLEAAAGRKHLIMTHMQREIWRGDKPTGEFTSAGFNFTGYGMNVTVEHFRDMDMHAISCAKKCGACFGIKLSECQPRPELVGDEDSALMGPECTFAHMGVLMFPDSELEDWE